MKFYLAARFEERERIDRLQQKLRSAGHEITRDWTKHDPLARYGDLPEKAQEYAGLTPTYKTVRESGPDHDKHFVVSVSVGDKIYGEGEGKSKQDAEQEAARVALESKGWK